jgi:thiosulfate/3-mercaptopyruvate sulfurtransferase
MHPLIGTGELADLLEGPQPPTLLDVRWTLSGPSGQRLFTAGHLPGAVFADIDCDLAGPPGAGGRHPLPDPADLQAALRRLGVRSDRPVVAYDAGDGSTAARVWWLLRWAGHDRVAVLDGGYAAWIAEGREVVTGPQAQAPNAAAELAGQQPGTGALRGGVAGVPGGGVAGVPGGGVADVPGGGVAGGESAEGDFVVRPGRMPVLTADEAAALPTDGGVLLDARAPQRFAGDVEPIDPIAGHVPGARNAPATGNVGADGRWLAPAALAERFAALGVRPDVPVGAYCGSGVTACSLVLALEVAGVTSPAQPAALYAGSWSQWCTDPSRPVAIGPD